MNSTLNDISLNIDNENNTLNVSNEVENPINNPLISIDELNKIRFDAFSGETDKYSNDFDSYYLNSVNVTDNCKYFISDLPRFNDDSLSIYFHNINSLTKHFVELISLFDLETNTNFDIISLCETNKLINEIAHLYEINDYKMFNNFNTRNSG